MEDQIKAHMVYYKPEDIQNKYICDKIPPICPTKGGSEFYLWRFNNFMKRHVDCDHEPPTYYYGPLETEGQINLYVKKVEDKNYKVIFPAIALLPIPRVIKAYILARDISDIREAWLELEKKLAKIQKDIPVTHRDTIPNISKSYGYKYCIAFNERLYPYLSETGQKWIKNALMNLQEYMDQGLCSQTWVAKENTRFNRKHKLQDRKERKKFYTNLELRSEDFKEFAFATHPDAYLDAGLQNIEINDLVLVMITPDFAEWKDWSTWEQAMLVADDVAIQKIEDTYNWGKQKSGDAYNLGKRFVRDVYKKFF